MADGPPQAIMGSHEATEGESERSAAEGSQVKAEAITNTIGIKLSLSVVEASDLLALLQGVKEKGNGSFYSYAKVNTCDVQGTTDGVIRELKGVLGK